MENWLKKSVLLSIFLTTMSAYADKRVVEFVDDGTLSTTGKRMHVCADGFMSGIHEKKNDLLCALEDLAPEVILPDFPSPDPLPNYNPMMDDYKTKREGMHACPLGMAMVGIHVKDNVLKCRRPRDDYFGFVGILVQQSEFVHLPPTSQFLRFGMHACPVGYVMTGVHIKGNLLLCTPFLRD